MAAGNVLSQNNKSLKREPSYQEVSSQSPTGRLAGRCGTCTGWTAELDGTCPTRDPRVLVEPSMVEPPRKASPWRKRARGPTAWRNSRKLPRDEGTQIL